VPRAGTSIANLAELITAAPAAPIGPHGVSVPCVAQSTLITRPKREETMKALLRLLALGAAAGVLLTSAYATREGEASG
jgi:hypothetical protein